MTIRVCLRKAILPFAAISLAIALLGSGIASAQELPRPVGFVNDFAGLIPDDTEAELEALLQQFEQETQAEIAVVTIVNLGGDTIEGYAVRLFQRWGIGKKGVDNGVLLLVAQEERDIRIEVGYGLEPYITDGKAGRILDQEILPDLRDNNYALGLLKGVRAIEEAIQASDYQPGAVRPRDSNPRNSSPGNNAFGQWGWLLWGAGASSIYAFNFLARSKAIWPGGIWGAAVGGMLGYLFGGLVGLAAFGAAAGAAGLAMDAVLSSAYRYQVANGKSTSWLGSLGGFSGAGHWGGRSGGGGGFGGFGGGRSGGGGASRGF
ncbi:MAG: TPM domain-containing protein [Chloroflexi bacterium]|nr:TPM domain-containing protein [Chloroflexota bacterium]